MDGPLYRSKICDQAAEGASGDGESLRIRQLIRRMLPLSPLAHKGQWSRKKDMQMHSAWVLYVCPATSEAVVKWPDPNLETDVYID